MLIIFKNILWQPNKNKKLPYFIKRKRFSEIDFIAIKINRAENGILLPEIPPVDLFRSGRSVVSKKI